MCSIGKLENALFYIKINSINYCIMLFPQSCCRCISSYLCFLNLAIYEFRAYRNSSFGFDSRRGEVYFLRLFCLSFELRVLITSSVYSNFYVRWVSVDILVSSIDKSNYIPKLLLLWR
jgi:hypothetical protein